MRTQGQIIHERNCLTQSIGDEFGKDEYDKAVRDMHDATCDAHGIARHGYELEFAKKRLAELRASA